MSKRSNAAHSAVDKHLSPPTGSHPESPSPSEAVPLPAGIDAADALMAVFGLRRESEWLEGEP